MNYNFKPFIDAIPSITSAYSLVAFTLVLLSFLVFILLRTKSPIFQILDRKFTKAQTFLFLNRIALYTFIFACLVFLLGYFTELGKIYKNKSAQTTVIIYDKSIDVSQINSIKSNAQSGYLISSDPAFSIPAPDLQNWENPIWVKDKADIQQYITLSMPKEMQFKGPFFDFLEEGQALFLISKKQADLEINQSSSFTNDSPFEESMSDVYPFTEPMVIKGRHHLGIIAISKSTLPRKFKHVDLNSIIMFYVSNLPNKPDRLITTNNNAILLSTTKFTNIIYQNNKQNINILKCMRFIDSGTHFFIIEGTCYAPDSNPDIRNYMLDIIAKFGVPYTA